MFYLCCVLHQTLSQQGRHRLQLLLSLPDVGVQLEDFLQVAAGGQVVLAEMRGNREARLKTPDDLNARLKPRCGCLAAPVNPCEPGLVCKRPSCCWAPAAAQSHSPLWPPQSDSPSGSRWLWMAAKTLSFRQTCQYLVSERERL